MSRVWTRRSKPALGRPEAFLSGEALTDSSRHRPGPFSERKGSSEPEKFVVFVEPANEGRSRDAGKKRCGVDSTFGKEKTSAEKCAALVCGQARSSPREQFSS
jgi:hypothetical protein